MSVNATQSWNETFEFRSQSCYMVLNFQMSTYLPFLLAH